MVLGAAKWRENIRKSKDPGFAPRPGQTFEKKNDFNQAIRELEFQRSVNLPGKYL